MSSTRKTDLSKTNPSSLEHSSSYQDMLEEIKTRITSSQTRAALAVNQELVLLYYEIGKQILEKQKQEGWGTLVIDKLAQDLKNAFPHLKGFSPRNLRYTRTLANDYPESLFRQSVTAQIPWGHLMKILDASKDLQERHFYMQQTKEHGWSQRVLDHHISTKLYQRQGKSLTNFAKALEKNHGHSAQQVLKDPYIFDFLQVGTEAEEREIEQGLMKAVEKFLIELGTGFAFVARQYHFIVGKKDRYIDLLFYHLKLRCFVVIELKAREFDPADTGQLNHYLSYVDDKLKHPQDNPSIGILLCKGKDKMDVEYALRDLNKPIGVSSYELSMLESLPEHLQSELPTVEQFEAKLKNENLLEQKQDS